MITSKLSKNMFLLTELNSHSFSCVPARNIIITHRTALFLRFRRNSIIVVIITCVECKSGFANCFIAQPV